MKAGLYIEDNDPYSVPEELLFIRKTKKDKILDDTGSSASGFKYGLNMNGQGSNCWAVHG
jgi:hypothetical protein